MLGRRDMMRTAAIGGVALAIPIGGRTEQPATGRRTALPDPLQAVAPELRPAAQGIQAMVAAMPPIAKSYTTMRAGPQPPPRTDIPYAEQRIPGAAGQPPVTVYVINTRAGAKRPAILHTHGGGYIVGSAKGSILQCQDLAKQLDCVVVTVEYRLAPETTYAGSVADNHAALVWLHANAAGLGVDPGRIAVMGESAGGGHAALLALMARDRRSVPLCAQVLIYPMLDDRTGSTRAVPPFIGRIGWDVPANIFGWRSFLGRAPGGRDVPAAGVPARVGDLSGLPPTFIAVGSVDLFVDEDIDYARRLISAGVPAELVVTPGGFHGFDAVAPETGLSKRFTAAKVAALRRAFGGDGAAA
ncbi:alpha/beta hydrolase [Sphingomonas sanguinis]|uniref:alpha/beta hydrolase n=1 Tax=Sphingomonas sp. LC-1 TaxID=3110957 RepID=UPI0021BACE78|nr:alpha/beta hydrolase [Sphingomonas sp. LC-1]MCT8003949.1 alpha/beta hydrolase [Sphingomonas sp. LC-1]